MTLLTPTDWITVLQPPNSNPQAEFQRSMYAVSSKLHTFGKHDTLYT